MWSLILNSEISTMSMPPSMLLLMSSIHYSICLLSLPKCLFFLPAWSMTQICSCLSLPRRQRPAVGMDTESITLPGQFSTIEVSNGHLPPVVTKGSLVVTLHFFDRNFYCQKYCRNRVQPSVAKDNTYTAVKQKFKDWLYFLTWGAS